MTRDRAGTSSCGDGAPTLLEIDDLVTHYPVRSGLLRRRLADVHAVDGVSLEVGSRQTLGIVGESGCGKTTLGRSILRLVEPTSGDVRLRGESIVAASRSRLRELRAHVQMVFQDPFASLNPRLPVRDTIAEPLRIHGRDRASTRARVAELLDAVGLTPAHGDRYPHEFSGGQRQRVGIARALALEPDVVVLDEPVSALDVSVRAQVVNLLDDLQQRLGLTYLFIAHDLSVVRHVSDRVAVMYLGQIVELTDPDTLHEGPAHPYTHALLSAVPVADPHVEHGRERIVLDGEMPSPTDPPAGCRFHTRCPLAEERCRVEVPQLRQLRPGHHAACHLALGPHETLAGRIAGLGRGDAGSDVGDARRSAPRADPDG